jgi:hypothetical protein
MYWKEFISAPIRMRGSVSVWLMIGDKSLAYSGCNFDKGQAVKLFQEIQQKLGTLKV